MARLTPPSLRFLVADPFHFIACGFGSGLSPWAPGTAGTLFALLTYPLLRLAFPDDMACLIVLGLLFILGVWACHTTGKHLGVIDHGAIVWDEIVPFWLVLLFTPPLLINSIHGTLMSISGLYWQLAAFALFRLFDITKPFPASFFDSKVKNGFGVMMDDLVAAAYSILVLAIAKHFIS
jgi:phosphatidylglycerophosphatase A